MKNYNVKGLVGRVSIDTDCFIKALNDKKDIILFVSGNNCPRCTLLENEIKEHPGVLIFEIKYEIIRKPRIYLKTCLLFIRFRPAY